MVKTSTQLELTLKMVLLLRMHSKKKVLMRVPLSMLKLKW